MGDGNVAPGPTKMLIHAHVLLGEITLSPKHYIHKRPEHPHAISTQGKLWCYGCGCVGFLLMPLVHPSVKHAGCTQLIMFVCRFYFFLLTAVRLQNSGWLWAFSLFWCKTTTTTFSQERLELEHCGNKINANENRYVD